jgi:hypothetical protein
VDDDIEQDLYNYVHSTGEWTSKLKGGWGDVNNDDLELSLIMYECFACGSRCASLEHAVELQPSMFPLASCC